MSNLHVIFGTGPLGQSVMRALHKRDVTVRMINRSGKRGEIPADVEVVSADAYDEAQVKTLTQGASVVYQCAQPAYTEWAEKFPPLQTAILNGTASNGAKLIVGDNLYMYGATGGASIHAHLPYQAKSVKGRVRAQMAQQLLDAHAQGTVQVAIGRGSDFYGEGVLDAMMGERVFGFMVAGKPASVFGKIDIPHTQTYIGDFGEALAILGEREEALGRAWHVPNAEPNISQREFIERIASVMGIPPQISPMPGWLFEGLSLVHPTLREFRELRYGFEEPYVVDSSDFIKTFGDISTPLDEGIARTVAWYRQHVASHA
ncbi:MAG: NAD-dependent epimerase/dehydratase family protein [Anaerolineae bacterium]